METHKEQEERRNGVRRPMWGMLVTGQRVGVGSSGAVDAVLSQLMCILAFSLHHEALRGRLSHL